MTFVPPHDDVTLTRPSVSLVGLRTQRIDTINSFIPHGLLFQIPILFLVRVFQRIPTLVPVVVSLDARSFALVEVLRMALHPLDGYALAILVVKAVDGQAIDETTVQDFSTITELCQAVLTSAVYRARVGAPVPCRLSVGVVADTTALSRIVRGLIAGVVERRVALLPLS